MGTLLGIVAALTFGVADFVAGMASRRVHYLRVTLAIQAIGAVVASILVALDFPGPPSGRALVWGVIAGIGSAVGTLALYRGLSRGQMSVASPLSAVGAAVIPAIVGFSLGDQLTPIAIAGVVLAIPGVWFVAKPSATTSRAGTSDGIIAGFGLALLFIGLHQAGDAGLWPVATEQVTVLVIVAIATGIAKPANTVRKGANQGWWVLAAGLLSIAATTTYFYASQIGLLTIAAVLTSIYPGFTVLLAAIVLHERPRGVQLLGLVACGIAITAITLG